MGLQAYPDATRLVIPHQREPVRHSPIDHDTAVQLIANSTTRTGSGPVLRVDA